MGNVWENEKMSVSLTNSQWNRLTTYLLMTTNFRQGELEAWVKLSEEKKPDGKPEFPNAPGQVDFWKCMIADIAVIRETIDNRLMGVVEDRGQDITKKSAKVKLIESIVEYGLENLWNDSEIIDALVGYGCNQDDFKKAGYGNFVKNYFEDEEFLLDQRLDEAKERSEESNINADEKDERELS